MAGAPITGATPIRLHRFPALWVLALLFLASAGEASAQQLLQRFAAVDPPAPDLFAVPAASELPPLEGDQVFYTAPRVVMSILGTLVGAVAGAVIAVELVDGPVDLNTAIGGMIGGGAGAAAGLLLPGPSPEPAVVPTWVGAATGFVVGIWGLNEPVEPMVPWFPALGAQIGFAWAAVSARGGT